MEVFDKNTVKERAAGLLEGSRPDLKRTAALHTAVSVGAVVAVNLIIMLLPGLFGDTGGLASLGVQSMLDTAQSALSLACQIALIFWDVGLLYSAMLTARSQPAEFSSLNRGFHRFGPVLRLNLLKLCVYMLAGMLCMNVVMIAAAFMPVSQTLNAELEAMTQTLQAGGELTEEMLFSKNMLLGMAPILILFMVAYGVMLLHLNYRFRLADFLVLDDPRRGALAALVLSNALIKGSKTALFKLDLSMWWYFALQLVLLAVANLGDILALAGVELPLSSDGRFFLFYILYGIGAVAAAYFTGARYQTVYATVYDHYRGQLEDLMQRRPVQY